MQITIQKRAFLRSLARTHGVADRKSSMPILSNILLDASVEDGLRLSATDLYLGMSSKAPAEVAVPGVVAVAARTLFDIVKNLPEGEITFSVGENQAAEIRCGKINYRIPGMPGEDFPPLPNPEGGEAVGVRAEVVAELIGLTQYSMSTDDTRPHLAGSLFSADDGVVRMVTTDGHRLSKAEHHLPADAPKPSFTMLVPHRGVAELRKLVDEARTDAKSSGDNPMVEIVQTGGHAFFQYADTRLSVKLAEEQFPPYEKVIPQSQTKRVVAARTRLIEALKRISLVANDKSGGVSLSLEPGSLKIQSQNPDVGEGSEEVDVDYDGETLSIGFNARYMLDVLNALNHDEVSLGLSGELDPGVIRPVGEGVDFAGVIMPMRI